MKKLSIFCGIALLFALMSGPAYAQSFGLDIDGDGVIDDPCETTIFTSETIQVDTYLFWPTDRPNVVAIDYQFHWDSDKMSVVSIDPNLKASGGPWDSQLPQPQRWWLEEGP